MLIIRQIFESLRFAFHALKANLLRTTLSLLGVTIGIFAIITVFTVVDSLERNINDSLSFLGRTNLDIRRFPFDFSGNMPWWDYWKRPYTNLSEYEFLRENLEDIDGITIFTATNVVAKHKNSSSNGVLLLGVSQGHSDVYNDFPELLGRYFAPEETDAGAFVAILGHRSKTELFGNREALGQTVKMRGRKFTVIGVVPEQGAGLLGDTSKDENIWIPYKAFSQIYYVGKGGVEPVITIKGKETGEELTELEYQIRGLVRKSRGLKPKEDDSFAIARQEAILNSIGGFFDVLTIGGWLIGGFSILIGGFGIANIMFVSVRERTNIIGIQKALGAKNYFVLLQFLFESIFLSVIGGGVGLLLVYLITFIPLGSLDLQMSLGNMIMGVGVAAGIGTISGIVPAGIAARMDPVQAIRSQ
ncbi:MAG: ABC transporter permease [Bacteroidota bacterium]